MNVREHKIQIYHVHMYVTVVMVLPLRLATSENLIKQFISSLHTPPPNSLKPSVGVLIGVALPES